MSNNANLITVRQEANKARMFLKQFLDPSLDRRASNFIQGFNNVYEASLRQLENFQFRNTSSVTLTHVFNTAEINALGLSEPAARVTMAVVKHLPYTAMQNVIYQDLVNEIVMLPDSIPTVKIGRGIFARNRKSVINFNVMLQDRELDWYLRHILILGNILILERHVCTGKPSTALLKACAERAKKFAVLYQELLKRSPLLKDIIK